MKVVISPHTCQHLLFSFFKKKLVTIQEFLCYPVVRSTAESMGSIPGWGTKISQATWHDQRKKRERNLALKNIIYKKKL